ncbi:MAG TPA: sigma-54-dependent Fis family transcriptional regulator [Desulfobulbaceae bacterium]|nr:sigma-54-dependent Fis family transcriptional regulator [Desulfobulbaceae bacterium]
MKHSVPASLNTLSFINALPHGMALLDGDGAVIALNSVLEAISGRRSEAVTGLPLNLVLRTSLPRNDVLKARSHATPISLETDIISAVRKKVPVRLTFSAISGDTQEKCTLCYLEDISAIRKFDQVRGGQITPAGLIGHSPAMQELLEFLPILARTDATVLITGETGTGKDILAQGIHDASKRAGYPFIKVNCGALPENLLESELFGHVRGAFTGAHADKPGMFRLAQGGTLFLTEIGDLPLQLQVKLLTVLDDREFFPVGSSKKVKVDVRVITGTHRDLKSLIRAGQFREDLYFRLNVLKAHLPPLRERKGDVRLLAEHFLQKFAAGLHKKIRGFDRQSMDILARYRYPGNIRELRNIVEYAANICQGDEIAPDHLPEVVRNKDAGQQDAAAVGPGKESAAGTPILAPSAKPAGNTWRETEKNMIMEVLLQCKGNRGEAAERLGWGRSTLWRKMKQHNII